MGGTVVLFPKRSNSVASLFQLRWLLEGFWAGMDWPLCCWYNQLAAMHLQTKVRCTAQLNLQWSNGHWLVLKLPPYHHLHHQVPVSYHHLHHQVLHVTPCYTSSFLSFVVIKRWPGNWAMFIMITKDPFPAAWSVITQPTYSWSFDLVASKYCLTMNNHIDDLI